MSQCAKGLVSVCCQGLYQARSHARGYKLACHRWVMCCVSKGKSVTASTRWFSGRVTEAVTSRRDVVVIGIEVSSAVAEPIVTR